MAGMNVVGSNDMTALDLSTISNGTITKNTSTEIAIKATDGTTYEFSGTFSGGSGSTMPTSGTITSWVAIDSGGSRVAMTMNLPVQTFEHFLQTDNATGLQDTIFSGNDLFNLKDGNGQNTVYGAGGDDTFQLGSTLDAQDSINGNGGYNTVQLDGDYSAGLTLADNTLTDINKLQLVGDYSYNITTADGTVAAGHTLLVDAKGIGGAGTLTFDGSAETDGKFLFFLGAAAGSTVSGGAGNDVFRGGGQDATLSGGGGNDRFIFGPNFDGTDHINGGTGINMVELNGDYSAGLTFGANALQNIEQLVLIHGNSYDLSLVAANLEVGSDLRVEGQNLRATDTLTFDGSQAQGTLFLTGGAGNDVLTGGAGRNTFDGGHGADQLNAGSSVNNFIYDRPSDSTGAGYDTINGFDARHDHFILNVAVSAIDKAVVSGSLSTATFNGDLQADIGSGQLGAHDAVLFTASAGTLAGDTFLIVDENGTAGYQAGHDLVIQLTNTHNMADFSTSNFTT